MYCDHCGARIPDYANFCRRCGASQACPTSCGETRAPAPSQDTSPHGAVAATVAERPTKETEDGSQAGWLPIAVIAVGLLLGGLPIIAASKGPAPTPNPVPVIAAEVESPTAAPEPDPPTATPEPEPTADPNAVVFTKYVSADGDGAYVRYAPDWAARVKAWPDGTSIGIIEFVSSDWARVRTPDGYIGYMPREYLSDWAPETPRWTTGQSYRVTLSNLRYERWGGPINEAEPCGPTSNGIPSRRVAYELTFTNLSTATFDWRFLIGLQLGGKRWMNACCYQYGDQPAIAPPLSTGSTGTATCFSFIDDSWGEMVAQQRIAVTWQDETHSWRLVDGKAIVEQ